MENHEYAQYLRKVADFFEAHPELKLPHEEIHVYGHEGVEDAVKVIRAFGDCEKVGNSSYLHLKKDFGGRSLIFVFSRSTTCERKVVGKRHHEARMIPAYDEEIVEWDCQPLLKRGNGDA